MQGYTEARRRARAVLGVEEEVPEKELKKARNSQMLKYHPDKNPNATDKIVSLITEAYDILRGEIAEPVLLNDNGLVALVTKIPEQDLGKIPSYEEWLKEHFFGCGIWPAKK